MYTNWYQTNIIESTVVVSCSGLCLRRKLKSDTKFHFYFRNSREKCWLVYVLPNVQKSFSVFILITVIAVTNAGLCFDKDIALCNMMANADPNMCNDPCMAKLCTRFCGQCRM